VSTQVAPTGLAEVGHEWKAALAHRSAPHRSAALWALAGLTAAGVAVRFSTLGLQSYHHDEVITAMRVIPGSFDHMLREVKRSESNPPLYYVLAWGWAKVFGTGEVGLRSLSALFGAATVPVGYLIGRQLATRRVGLILAALLAFNPMLIWYSQEARSYALLVFFAALSLYFFVKVLDTRRGRDLAFWAVASALALCSHYFAFFAVGIEAAWLLVRCAPAGASSCPQSVRFSRPVSPCCPWSPLRSIRTTSAGSNRARCLTGFSRPGSAS
jgi:Predicted membrane protein